MKKRTVFGPHSDQTFSERNYILLQHPDCSNNHVRHEFPATADTWLCKKQTVFRPQSSPKQNGTLNKVQSEVPREFGSNNPAPSHLFRSSPEEKSGQFLVRTHVRKMGKSLRFLRACQEI
jgi:hypothetical protein